jgi:hypothetical protein
MRDRACAQSESARLFSSLPPVLCTPMTRSEGVLVMPASGTALWNRPTQQTQREK